MASTNKTQPTDASVSGFLNGVSNARRREDGLTMCSLMTDITGVQPVMWGPSIVGFGEYTYRHDSGREGTMPRVGFSPRSTALSLYGLTEHPASNPLLEKLGPHTTGAACLYVKRLDQVDMDILTELIEAGWAREDADGAVGGAS